MLSQSYLEGVYSEVYPEKSLDIQGLQKFFKYFSFPRGIGSHATPETPGSIHEGGELGYSISHAFGSVFDHPDLIALTMVGDGEAEAGSLATSWHSTKFLNPITDDAVLPVYQKQARDSGKAFRPRWPMIVLRTPKGWTAPRKVDDNYLGGFWRAHQVPITDVNTNADHLKVLETWMRGYEPERLFDKDGGPVATLRTLCPEGNRRMSANLVANGGLLKKPLKVPNFRDYAVKVDKPGATMFDSMTNMSVFLRDIIALNMHNFRLFGPDETESNKLARVYEAGKKVWMGDYFEEDENGGNLAMAGRVMEMLSEHTCEGWLEGYILSGRHGLLNSYEPFIHIIDSMVNQVR